MPRPNKLVRTLHQCDSCGHKFALSPAEMSAASRPKCWDCGSTRLIVASKEGHQRLQAAQARHRELHDRKFTQTCLQLTPEPETQT